MASNKIYGLSLRCVIQMTFISIFLSSMYIVDSYSIRTTVVNTRDIPNLSKKDEGDSGPFYEPTEEELQIFKKIILDSLGLKKVPDVSKMNVSKEEYARMNAVYEERIRKSESRFRSPVQDEEKSQTVLLVHQNVEPYEERRKNHTWQQWNIRFHPDQTLTMEQDFDVQSSSLTLRWSTNKNSSSSRRNSKTKTAASLSLSIIVDGHDSETAVDGETLLSQWRSNNSAVIEVDIQERLTDWLQRMRNRSNSSELNLQIICQGQSCSLFQHWQLQAELKLNITSVSRSRRSYQPEEIFNVKKEKKLDCRKHKKRTCCRHSLKINFQKLREFEWILSPRITDLYMCKGKCQYPHNPAHNHALFQGFLHTLNKTHVPKLCCTPTKLKDLDVLFLRDDDSSKLGVATWENAIVTECACA